MFDIKKENWKIQRGFQGQTISWQNKRQNNYNELHRKRKIEQREPNKNLE